ncbi:MAG: hypothetical protein IJX17_03090, partial [Clostridia bacterium]|nr:hypothetical protein [Clostridia bacterium]
KKSSGLFSLGNLLCLVAIVAGVVAVCMIAMPSLKIESALSSLTGPKTYSGLKAVFGSKVEDYEYMSFSFMNLLPYILVLAGVVVLALKVLGKMGGLANIVAVVAFVAAGILFLFVNKFVVLSDVYELALKLAEVKIGVGALISAICSFVAGACALVPVFVKK